MRKLWTIVAILAIAVAIFGTVACSDNDEGNSTGTAGLVVNGEGKVSAKPDLAILSLGIESQANTVAEARDQAAAAMDKVMVSLKTNGLAEKDIQTSSFSIYPVTRWNEDKQEQIILGYRVTNIVTAKIRNMDKAGAVIDSAAEAGGDLTRVQGISFTIEDPTAYQQQAREKAFAAAKQKAEQMARLAGVKLGKPVSISESGGYIPFGPVAFAEKAAMDSTPISPGEQDITVNVSISYEIE